MIRVYVNLVLGGDKVLTQRDAKRLLRVIERMEDKIIRVAGRRSETKELVCPAEYINFMDSYIQEFNDKIYGLLDEEGMDFKENPNCNLDFEEGKEFNELANEGTEKLEVCQ